MKYLSNYVKLLSCHVVNNSLFAVDYTVFLLFKPFIVTTIYWLRRNYLHTIQTEWVISGIEFEHNQCINDIQPQISLLAITIGNCHKHWHSHILHRIVITISRIKRETRHFAWYRQCIDKMFPCSPTTN